MDEEKTFNRLKRCTYEEMIEKWTNFRPIVDPVYNVCSTSFQRSVIYPETTFLYEKTKILEENGWTLEELAYESEKRAVMVAVAEINTTLSNLDPKVIAHAKKFFPHLTITPAIIDLGE